MLQSSQTGSGVNSDTGSISRLATERRLVSALLDSCNVRTGNNGVGVGPEFANLRDPGTRGFDDRHWGWEDSGVEDCRGLICRT